MPGTTFHIAPLRVVAQTGLGTGVAFRYLNIYTAIRAGADQLSGHFLWSGLLRKYRETSAFLAYFRSNAAEFLCS